MYYLLSFMLISYYYRYLKLIFFIQQMPRFFVQLNNVLYPYPDPYDYEDPEADSKLI